MAEKRLYEIVYDSDFIIDDPSELSTLCVFYDKVYLPCRGRVKSTRAKKPQGDQPKELEEKDREGIWWREEAWESENRVLFQEGVLERLVLSPSDKIEERYGVTWLAANEFFKSNDDQIIEELSNNPVFTSGQSKKLSVDKFARAMHHLYRQDIELPRLATDFPKFSKRESFKTLLANRAFCYLVPTLSKLHPETVLEIREKSC